MAADIDVDEADRGTRRARKVSLATIIALWLFHFFSMTAARFFQGIDTEFEVLVPRAVVVTGGVVITLVMAQILGRFKLDGAVCRVAATFLAALGGCVTHTVLNYIIFYRVWRMASTSDISLVSQALAMANWFWVYLSVTAVLMTQRYSADLADRDIRLARIESSSRTAELKALRYQLNPHFLFNALNSIAALIGQSKGRSAQTMVENLADFLRASLSLDFADDITLAQEVELQKLYLSVEAERFPDRLRFHADIPADLQDAQIPSLILQPLVENAIKYAVAQSIELVTIRIAAERAGTRIRVTVSDDGGDAPPSSSGASVGLRNVRERLRARFGDAARFEAGSREQGGYAAVLTFPLVAASRAA